MRKWHGIDVCIGAFVRTVARLAAGPHRSMGPACAVRRAGMLISRGCRFAFCGALRTDPRPFRQEEPAGALFPPAGAVRQFSELAFPCVLRGPRAVQGRPLRDVPPAVSGGPVPFGGPSAWRHHHLDRRGGGVEAAARLARAARFPRVSDRKQPRLPPHHRAYSGPRGLAGHGAAARERPSDADRSFAAFRQRSFLAVLRADPLP